jgi:hypothetical protein
MKYLKLTIVLLILFSFPITALAFTSTAEEVRATQMELEDMRVTYLLAYADASSGVQSLWRALINPMFVNTDNMLQDWSMKYVMNNSMTDLWRGFTYSKMDTLYDNMVSQGIYHN